MKRIFLWITLIVAFTANNLAQASITLHAPNTVREGERFAITYRIENSEPKEPKAPQIDGCKFLYGPSVSTMQSYQIINGKTSGTSIVEFTYTYRAEKAGNYKIGKKPFKVIPSGSKTQDQTTQQQTQQTLNDIPEEAKGINVGANDVFIRIILSKSQAYEQEAIECTIKLYTKFSITKFMQEAQPSYDGYLIEEIPIQQIINREEVYNGQTYMTAVLQKYILYPQKSGKLTINSGKYRLVAAQQELVRFGFIPHITSSYQQLNVNSNSASINILELPQPQPEGFNGAVGQFSIDSKLGSSSFRTNETSSMIYTISGTGNIKYLKEPEIKFPSDFETYAPQSDISAKPTSNNVAGTMTIEYPFAPQSVGKFKIGMEKFVYFDPEAKKYVTLSTPTYDIDVAKGNSMPVSEQKDITAKATDILHIKTGDKSLSHDHEPIIYSLNYWMIYILLTLMLIAVLLAARKRNKLAADTDGLRLSRANKVARRRLKVAAQYMNSRQSDKFYDETLKAVWGYLSDKLTIPASQLNRENIANELQKYGAPDSLIQQFIDTLDQCEIARYTPTQSDQQIESTYKLASSAMEQLANIKRVKR